MHKFWFTLCVYANRCIHILRKVTSVIITFSRDRFKRTLKILFVDGNIEWYLKYLYVWWLYMCEIEAFRVSLLNKFRQIHAAITKNLHNDTGFYPYFLNFCSSFFKDITLYIFWWYSIQFFQLSDIIMMP